MSISLLHISIEEQVNYNSPDYIGHNIAAATILRNLNISNHAKAWLSHYKAINIRKKEDTVWCGVFFFI